MAGRLVPVDVNVNVSVNAKYDSRIDTYHHIQTVQAFVGLAVTNLIERARVHDQSKLESPERETFDVMTPKLAGSTYGSDEYKAFLVELGPALQHHYAANDHHPEHYARPYDPNLADVQAARDEIEHNHTGPWATWAVNVMDADIRSRRSQVRQMSLLSILEMLCDWKAATMRHADGNLLKSIEINQRRFGYSDELKDILLNTVAELGLA